MPLSAEPLNFPLNFTWTDKATAKAGAALLTQGDYDAIELRKYAELQKCHGCDTREKAKTLIVVRDRLTGETFEIGQQCMGDLYGVNVATLDQHASDVARTRRSLALKLGLTGCCGNSTVWTSGPCPPPSRTGCGIRASSPAPTGSGRRMRPRTWHFPNPGVRVRPPDTSPLERRHIPRPPRTRIFGRLRR